jgi:RES domain-containing protein
VGLNERLTAVSGRFFRAVDGRDKDWLCETPRARPARFHRAGERAFYASPSPDAAAIAIGGVVREGDHPRVVLAFDVTSAYLLDLREAASCAHFGVSYEDAAALWEPALEAGADPPSWAVADKLRAQGVHGLIDPSRRAPGIGLWHITLFRWNEPGAPQVALAGGPRSISIPLDYCGGAGLLADWR